MHHIVIEMWSASYQTDIRKFLIVYPQSVLNKIFDSIYSGKHRNPRSFDTFIGAISDGFPVAQGYPFSNWGLGILESFW